MFLVVQEWLCIKPQIEELSQVGNFHLQWYIWFLELNKSQLKGNSHQKISLANMIGLLLRSFLAYHLPVFEAWKVPKRPVEVSCDITPHCGVPDSDR